MRRVVVALVMAVCAAASLGRSMAADALPSRLTNQEFWTLISTASEPDGNFRSDNLVSNEVKFQWVIPELVRRTSTMNATFGLSAAT